MEYTTKIPIPTDLTTSTGTIEQKVIYLGGKKCNSVKWNILEKPFQRASTLVSRKFDVTLAGDDTKTLTWSLAIVKSEHSSSYFYLLPWFMPENDCKEVVVILDLFIFDYVVNAKRIVASSYGNVCSFVAAEKHSSTHLLFNASNLVKCVSNVNCCSLLSSLTVGCNIIQSHFAEVDLYKDLTNAIASLDHDVTLLSNDGNDYKAHKLMLSARSSVFSAMFAHKMKENVRNEVKIKDCNGEVVEEMLRYIYTGKVEKLERLAKDLLVAAEKYDMKGLKTMSEDMLFSTLVASNAVEILQLADLHNAPTLKTSAIEFIIRESSEVKKTKAWKNLKQSNFNLLKIICDASLSRNENQNRKQNQQNAYEW